MANVHFGVTLPQIKRSWQETRAAALECEALGFQSLWLNDHLYGIPAPTIPILEGWTALSAVGAVTAKPEIGLLVSPPAFRNPALQAKMAATLDHITGGRVVVGLGAGWFVQEYEGYGYPFPAARVRLEQLAEAVTIMKRMWTEEAPSFAGKHFRIDGVFCLPKPARRPPILIGGGGEKVLLRLVAEHADLWNNLAVHQGALPAKIEMLRRHCRDVGRDFDSIRLSQQTLVVIGEDERDGLEKMQRATALYRGHLGDIEKHGIWGSAQQVIERIERHVALGVRHFVIEFFGRDTREPARLFAEQVMPAFR
ncbi:MAG: LLM class flavin-dependent oxidoreductase [Deltaproteobacteria bacterium]|nr:LLM class flavin-dependent oxidoreductase [Deltaproteobacteria bacterium]